MNDIQQTEKGINACIEAKNGYEDTNFISDIKCNNLDNYVTPKYSVFL